MRRLAGLLVLALASCASPRPVAPMPAERAHALADVEVLVTADGAPVPGADVLLFPPREGAYPVIRETLATLTTDARGHAHAIVREPLSDCHVGKPGFLEARDFVRASGPTVRLHVELEREALLAGTVLDFNARPVAGAHVIVIGGAESAITDGEGRFSLKGLRPRASSYDLAVNHVSRPDLLPGAFTSATPPRDDVRLLLAPAGQLEVALTRPGGATVDTRAAQLLLDRRCPSGWRRATHVPASPTHGRPGRLTVGHLEPGTYRVLARLEGVAATISGPIEVSPEKTVRVALELRAGRTITVTVRDPRGRPLRATFGELGEPGEEDGALELRNVPREPFRLTVAPPFYQLNGLGSVRFEPFTVEVPADTTRLDLVVNELEPERVKK